MGSQAVDGHRIQAIDGHLNQAVIGGLGAPFGLSGVAEWRTLDDLWRGTLFTFTSECGGWWYEDAPGFDDDLTATRPRAALAADKLWHWWQAEVRVEEDLTLSKTGGFYVELDNVFVDDPVLGALLQTGATAGRHWQGATEAAPR